MPRTPGNRAVIAVLLAMRLGSFDASCADISQDVILQHPVVSFQLRVAGETWALKFARLRKLLVASGAKDVPQVFLSADLAATVVLPLATTTAAGIANIPGIVPLETNPEGKFSFEGSLKYVAELFGLSLKKTDHGYLLEFSQAGKIMLPH